MIKFPILVGTALLCVTALLAASSPPALAEEDPLQCPAADHPVPRTVDAAVERLLSRLSAEDKEALRKMQREDLIRLHHGFGTGIRNDMCLWGGNNDLIRSACKGELCHPDDASMLIIEALWERLQVQQK